MVSGDGNESPGDNPPSVTPTTEETLAQVLARMAELEEQLRATKAQLPAPNIGTKRERKLELGQPFTFDGSHDDVKVNGFINKLGTVIRLNEKLRNTPLDDDDKLLIAEQHMEDTPLRQYYAEIAQEGAFKDYEAFVTWLRMFFVPPDILAKYRLDYRRIRQRDNETLDQYQLRFVELLNKLDEKPKPSFIVSDFVNTLRGDIAQHLVIVVDKNSGQGKGYPKVNQTFEAEFNESL